MVLVIFGEIIRFLLCEATFAFTLPFSFISPSPKINKLPVIYSILSWTSLLRYVENQKYEKYIRPPTPSTSNRLHIRCFKPLNHLRVGSQRLFLQKPIWQSASSVQLQMSSSCVASSLQVCPLVQSLFWIFAGAHMHFVLVLFLSVHFWSEIQTLLPQCQEQ